MESNILSSLNPEQLTAVKHTEGPVLILAGAGSGKTRVITYRIAYLISLGVPSDNIVAVTFTNKAADEMKSRVKKLVPSGSEGCWISTFHSWGVRFLRREAKKINLPLNFVIYDEADQKDLLKETLRELQLDEKQHRPGWLADIINRAKDNLLDADSYAIHSMVSGEEKREVIAKVYRRYQQKLEQATALDFGDLILKPVEILRDYSDLRRKYQDQVQYLLVDEYQDINHAQYMLVKHLSGKHRNLCVVGDDDQAIYSWRGADVRNLWRFNLDFKDTKIFKLEQNYRSTPEILTTANEVIQHNKQRKNKRLWTQNATGPVVTFHQTVDEVSETEFIVKQINLLREEIDPKLRLSQIAIFYRVNAQSRVIEEIFRRYQIPYTIIGTLSFYERLEIKDILAYLKVIHNINDSLSLKRILNRPQRGIGKNSLNLIEEFMELKQVSLFQALQQVELIPDLQVRVVTAIREFMGLMDKFIKHKDKIMVSKLIREILETTGYLDELELDANYQSRNRIANLKELISAARDFETSTDKPNLSTFLSQIAIGSDIDQWEEKKETVTLMTLHLAKGLEFPVVFITGMEEGLFPLGVNVTTDELEEERRLCYVGMTRAKRRLYLTCAARRRIYGEYTEAKVSRFIKESKIKFTSDKPVLNEVYGNPKFTGMLNRNTTVVEIQPEINGAKESFYLGQRVRHTEFGLGEIIEANGSGENQKLLIKFDTGQKRKLLAKYANLEKL